MSNISTVTRGTVVLPINGVRSWLFHGLLVGSAVLLPAIAHLADLPVRWLLPMHWPIILAGLVYGWRSGMIVGLLAPCTSWLLTGYPLPLKLLPMTIELAVYGFLAGWLKERLGWNDFAAVAVALAGGRIVFLAAIFTTGVYNENLIVYIMAAMVPGLVAGALQVGALPYFSKLLTDRK